MPFKGSEAKAKEARFLQLIKKREKTPLIYWRRFCRQVIMHKVEHAKVSHAAKCIWNMAWESVKA